MQKEKTPNSILNANQLVEEHGDYLFHFAHSKLKDREKSLDMVQDTLLAVLEKHEQFEGRSSFRTWMISILHRKILDLWRKKGRTVDFEDLDGIDIDPSDFAQTDTDLLRNERHEGLKRCLAKMPEQWQKIVEAKYFNESSGEEICKEFKITSSNFWVIIHRAKIHLRECLGEKFLYEEL
jgi:RNA polymerase sigma factor (sigma-70 family)